MSSGYMLFVSANSASLKTLSETPNRFATPGRYQTGSMAALVTTLVPSSVNTMPSGVNLEHRNASKHSGSCT